MPFDFRTTRDEDFVFDCVALDPDREPRLRDWLDLQRRSGDIYGGNGIRVGWPSEGRAHELVVQFEGRRGTSRIQVWTGPANSNIPV